MDKEGGYGVQAGRLQEAVLKKGFINILIGIMLTSLSIIFFFLFAEGVTRAYDGYLAKEKVTQSEYDWSSRLAGYAIEKKPDVFRILVLGDSIAYGQGVQKNDTFSKKLEGMLNDDAEAGKVEVINTGFCGIDTTKELSILLNQKKDVVLTDKSLWMDYPGMAYKPDLILLQYTVQNDAEYYGSDAAELHPPHRWRDGVKRYNYGDYALPLPENLDRWLTKHSKFYLFYLNKHHGFLTRVGLRDESKRIKGMYQPNAMGWLQTRSAIGQIGQIAKTYNIPSAIVLWATDDGGKLNDVYLLVGEAGRKSGLHVLDLSKAVQWPKENFAVSKTDGHPNAKAHAIAAEAIYKFLKEESLVPEK